MFRIATPVGYEAPRSNRLRLPSKPVRGEWVGTPPTPDQRILYYLHRSGFVACPLPPTVVWSGSCYPGPADRRSSRVPAALPGRHFRLRTRTLGPDT